MVLVISSMRRRLRSLPPADDEKMAKVGEADEAFFFLDCEAVRLGLQRLPRLMSLVSFFGL